MKRWSDDYHQLHNDTAASVDYVSSQVNASKKMNMDLRNEIPMNEEAMELNKPITREEVLEAICKCK